ncbi:MAG: hypothetical protein WAU10_09475 [Caldilineaceae bacterium]
MEEFESNVRTAISSHLFGAQIHLEVQRRIVLQGRIVVDNELFLHIYFNALTSKTIYALIHRGQRVMGYDNYRFWHYHPFASPNDHIPCDEPDVNDVLTAVAAAIKAIQSNG